jgi:hypothetical protein
MIARLDMAAVIADVELTPESRRATVLDRPQRAQLGRRQVAAMSLAVFSAGSAHDVGQLQRSKAHRGLKSGPDLADREDW